MTLIVGLKTNDSVVIGAEQEESSGLTAKRTVTKLKLIAGTDWAVVVGAAGDSYLGEKAMQRMGRELEGRQNLTEEVLTDVTDKILDFIYTKYVDKDPKSEGISLVVGAVCGNQLHLISTLKRVPQEQDSIAYAGYGADIGIFFMDRLHREDADREYTAKVAGFTLQQATEACQYCGGESEVYVLQRRPNPRWRFLGRGDMPTEFQNQFQKWEVSKMLRKFLDEKAFGCYGAYGYSDEFHPEPVDDPSITPFFPFEFFPSSWLRSTAYQKRAEEICNRNYNTILQFGLVKTLQKEASPPQAKDKEPALPQKKATERKEKPDNSGTKS